MWMASLHAGSPAPGAKFQPGSGESLISDSLVNDRLDILRIVGERLATGNIPFVPSGSLAMAYDATPRMTRDIDIVVELDPSVADLVVDLLEPDFLIRGPREADRCRSFHRSRSLSM